MRLPDFYIIGAAKAGSTTLYEYLRRHPDIFLSEVKEPEFFARDENYARGMESYAKHFSKVDPSQLCGEASTIYTRHPQFPRTAARIASHTPRARFIYLMREPVARAYSHYVQEVKTAQNLGEPWAHKRTFELALDHSRVYVDSSDYRLQIEQYLRHFRREQILLTTLEELIDRPLEVLAEVLDFLGVDPKLDLLEEGVVLANQSSSHFDRQTRKVITRHIRGTAIGRLGRRIASKELRERIWRLLLRSRVGRHTRQRETPPPMTAQTRAELQQYFESRRPGLEELFGRSLADWSRPT